MRTGALWQSVDGIGTAFNLNEAELRATLGGVSEIVLRRGVKNQDVEVSQDVIERVSLLLGIYKSLHVLFEQPRQANGWIDRPNELVPFNGECPREFIVSGDIESLTQVHQFLQYWRA